MGDSRDILGVALTRCFYCGEAGNIYLNKRLTKSDSVRVKQMHGKIVDMEPCSKCENWMKQGIILLGIDSEKSPSGWHVPPTLKEDREGWMPNPYRTGLFVVMREEAYKRLFRDSQGSNTVAQGLKLRWIFIDEEVIKQLGLDKAAAEFQG